jgi:hypothetical protein
MSLGRIRVILGVLAMMRPTEKERYSMRAKCCKASYCLLIVWIAPFLFGCSKGDPLPNGYKVFFASSTEVSLVKPSSGSAECIAGPHVAELGNSGKYIFGRIEFKGAGPAAESSNAGFFVIDSSTDEVKTGLDREKWLAELKAAGIDAPQLDPPEYKWPRH